MGYYVNPIAGREKEAFLYDECEECSLLVPTFEEYSKDDCLPVILIDNGAFKAAGIAFSKQEFEAFTRIDDRRPKVFFRVKIEKLLQHSDLSPLLVRCIQINKTKMGGEKEIG